MPECACLIQNTHRKVASTGTDLGRLVCICLIQNNLGRLVCICLIQTQTDSLACFASHSNSANSLTNAFFIFQKNIYFYLVYLVLELAQSNWRCLSSLSHSYTFFQPPPLLTWPIRRQAQSIQSSPSPTWSHATTLHPEKMYYKEKNYLYFSTHLFSTL